MTVLLGEYQVLRSMLMHRLPIPARVGDLGARGAVILPPNRSLETRIGSAGTKPKRRDFWAGGPEMRTCRTRVPLGKEVGGTAARIGRATSLIRSSCGRKV